MGSNQSNQVSPINHRNQLTPEMLEELKMISTFTDNEIHHLAAIFQEMDADGSGKIQIEELRRVPALANNPFLDRIVEIYDKNNDHKLEFKEFANLMSTFSPKASKEQKLRFLFSVFDYDGNSRIDRNDLRTCLRKMVQDQLTQEELATVIEKVFEEVDPQRSGSITYEAFAKVLHNSDVESRTTFDF